MKPPITSALTLLSLTCAVPAARAQTQAWIRQFGTATSELVNAAAPDGSSGAYIGGSTLGSLGGPQAGAGDAWLARYDGAGNRAWTRQLGTSASESLTAAAADGSGGTYVGGATWGNLGGSSAGNGDAWVARYGSSGNQLWIRQFGSAAADQLNASAPDGSGGVFVGGVTWGNLGGPYQGGNSYGGDAWIARYDVAGNQLWVRHLGTSAADYLTAAAADGAGGVYVAGGTDGNLGGPQLGAGDGWLARFDPSGTLLWTRQLGTAGWEQLNACAPDDSGGVFVAGDTSGAFGGPSAGQTDVWIARYDGAGNPSWIRQLGSTQTEQAWSATADGRGGVIVGGHTYGSLFAPYLGVWDAWFARFDPNGTLTSAQQLGTPLQDVVNCMTSDASGAVFVVGNTDGSLGAANSGSMDVWIARYDFPCSSSASYCSPGTTTNGCLPSIAGAGSASASAGSGFTISIDDVEGAQSGLIFYGLSGAVAFPWGTSTSFMCVKSPLERTPVQNSGGTYGACDGVLSIDWNLYIATHPSALGNPFVGGESVWAQGWFRDPPSAKTTNLSNGLLFSVCP